MKKSSVLRQVILGVSLAAIPVLIAAPALSLASDRTLGETVEDAMLATKVKAALLTDLGFDAMGIDVTARSGAVILEGTVDKRTTAEQSEPVAQAVDGVTSVTHRVKVEASPTKTPVGDAVGHGEREVADALLESRVKMALLSEIGTNAFDIEVEATDGTVSLRGKVADSKHEKLALQTAKKCDGVKKVIDLIDTEA